jgi:hypothetical protein
MISFRRAPSDYTIFNDLHPASSAWIAGVKRILSQAPLCSKITHVVVWVQNPYRRERPRDPMTPRGPAKLDQ